ncbi:Uma2 family endonuclease [Dolichospermum circinale CS-1225]|jgi:Uma2 family endonuclease|uniref:Uma2 family endonuclease n=1 Tax=Dolichospermum TaxID=748770 RepID=UPI00040F07F4|nr:MULTISPECIES: Uma2 family endonuclease [Dolichospermum]MCW9680225.1 Uma2 family endonuclease [Dolichospermum planctonicum UHCC 0167]MDB9522906.1 Uma2 family endonuclease [Dolichospermum circinale CS-1225]
MVLQLIRHQFTVKQFHKMAESGILSENERVELIRGEMIDMSPIGRRHAGCVNRLVNLLIQLLGKRIILAPQNPVVLNETSEPQPDIALLKPRPDFYRNSHPQPEDIFLLIEVADTTVKYDREVKIPLYAEANIPEVWLVDVNQEIIEVYRNSLEGIYQDVQKLTKNQSLSILAFPDVSIHLSELF